MTNGRHHHRRRQDRRAHKKARAAEKTPVLEHERVVGAEPEMVDTQDALDALVAALGEAGSFAYDTEFIGEQSYEPKICVIQVATHERLALVDPLVGLDLSAFWALMADPQLQKIVHAGEQDLEHAARRTGEPCRNVFDTQVAAGFTGCRYPMSLEKLLAKKTDARLAGKLTFTQWDRRPLSDVQVRYAADDVRYLPLVAEVLAAEVEAAGHTDWCERECAERAAAADPSAQPVREVTMGRGTPRERAILAEVAAWREMVARAQDLPPRSLIGDGVLRYLAQSQPDSVERLGKVRDLPRPIVAEHGEALIERIAAGREAEPPPARQGPRLPERGDHREAVETLWRAMRDRCERRGISVDLVAAKKHVARHALAAAIETTLEDDPLLQGWREELAGELLRNPPGGEA